MENQWIVGVDLGGTTTKIAFITLDGEIISKWEIPTDNSDEGIHITSNIAKAIDGKLVELGKDRSKLLGIGMGAPGPVNYETGIIRNAVNLGWKDNFPLQAQLEKATSLPVMIENDANCAALGEMWMGAGEGTKDLVFVTLGTGVGGGIIVGGDIVRGVNGAGGEIGHITVVPNGGAHCNCGRSGCLETVTSATGIVRLAKESLATADVKSELVKKFAQSGHITAKDVFDAARNGNEEAGQIVDKVAFYLGLALGGIANTLNPEKIVLGGGVSKAGDILLDAVKKKFAKYAFSSVKESVVITLAALGNDAGVFGAAWLIKNRTNK